MLDSHKSISDSQCTWCQWWQTYVWWHQLCAYQRLTLCAYQMWHRLCTYQGLTLCLMSIIHWVSVYNLIVFLMLVTVNGGISFTVCLSKIISVFDGNSVCLSFNSAFDVSYCQWFIMVCLMLYGIYVTNYITICFMLVFFYVDVCIFIMCLTPMCVSWQYTHDVNMVLK